MHGLGSNPHTAWAHRASPTSSPVKWLQDFLPKEKKLKGLKIIQVNHQTTWHANVSVTAFNDHARNILQDIESAHAVSVENLLLKNVGTNVEAVRSTDHLCCT